MAEEPHKHAQGEGEDTGAADATGAGANTPPPHDDARERDRGISDMFRRAVAVGLEAAGKSKDDFVRVASNEIRNWLNHLELDTELRKALSKMVLEVKAEIRFRPSPEGTVSADTSSEVRVRGERDRPPER